MYFRIWKSPLIILLFLGYKASSVAGGKVLSDITVHICILSYRILLCAHCQYFGCCATVNEVYMHVLREYMCVLCLQVYHGRGICVDYDS